MTDLSHLLATTDTVIAVVGATDSAGKYGGIIYRDLKARGYQVRPVNPRRSAVDGDHCHGSLSALSERPDIVNLVVPPAVGLAVAAEAVSLGIGNFWLQPGADSPDLIAYLEANGVTHLTDACIMISSRRMLRTA